MRNAGFGLTEFDMHAAVGKPGKGVVEVQMKALDAADDQQLKLR